MKPKFALVFLLACSGTNSSTTSAPETTDGASADIGIASAGVYTVPVPEALAHAATFPVAEVGFREKKGEVRLQYDFPVDLTGVPQRVVMTGARTGAGYELSGAAGTASCTPNQEGELVCVEKLPGVAVDMAMVANRWGEASPGVQVSELFRGDPVGILTFRPRAEGAED